MDDKRKLEAFFDKLRGARDGGEVLAAVRLCTGLVQGLLLYLLYRAERDNAWPANEPMLFVPALLVVLFVPLIVISGVGNLRVRTLALWKSAAVALLIGLGLHDVVRAAPTGKMMPTLPLIVFAAAGLFIAHALIVAADKERRLTASYGGYFDAAWKHIIQAALAAAFTGVFWLLYALSASLFELIGIRLFERLAEKAWFVIPLSAAVVAFALHMTDVHAGIVRGLRNLGLTLLSWLLVMMAGMMVAFLFALPFTGLEILWKQTSATALLLGVAASLVVLINAAYQDGAPGNSVAVVVRYAGWAATIALVPLIGLAACGLWLRVHQYGFTPYRVIALACVVVGSVYALGYTLSLRTPKRWLGSLARTNLVASLLILGVLFALFTPVADPARLSVSDQMARIEKGLTKADDIDFDFLRYDSARYGLAALKTLAAKKDDPVIAAKADAALKRKNRWSKWSEEPPSGPQEIAAQIMVYPKGQSLPDDFLKQNWRQQRMADLSCLRATGACDAFQVDVAGDASREIILVEMPRGRAVVFVKSKTAEWNPAGNLNFVRCAGVLDALRNGDFTVIAPEVKDLNVNDVRLRVEPFYETCDGVRISASDAASPPKPAQDP